MKESVAVSTRRLDPCMRDDLHCASFVAVQECLYVLNLLADLGSQTVTDAH